jgi:hypothetical protein
VNDDGQQQPERVHSEMSLDALDLLPRVVTALAAGPSRFDGLTVDTAGAGFGLLSGRRPDLTAGRVIDLVPEPATTPPVKVVPDRSLGGKIMGQSRPDPARGQDGEEGVEDLAKARLPRGTRRDRRRPPRFDSGALRVGQVAGIRLATGGVHANLLGRDIKHQP